MADTVVSLDNIKAFWNAQIHDEEKWALNMVLLLFALALARCGHAAVEEAKWDTLFVKLLRAAGLFAGSIFLMRNFGEYMAI
ncbi:Mitochondrial import receptor subunit TOM5-like [Vitis vinifera]|uniref:Mitochondrial import receptor subunit TOM5-like n=1 Tax=Vitis vinifera TaxID=29760 RepID=A0A438I3E2_VITVI|nr:Mitochondrial import receptor subunit TOM5-like [Vitis vinifera]